MSRNSGSTPNSYFVATIGGADQEAVQQYVQNQRHT